MPELLAAPELPITTQAMHALQARLASITRANGYHTDLGLSVWRGFWILALGARQHVPILALQSDTERPTDTRQDRAKLSTDARLVLVVDALPRSEDDATAGETALEAGLADLRRCLLMDQSDDLTRVLKHNGVTLGAAEYALAEDSRYALASMPVTMECVEHYT